MDRFVDEKTAQKIGLVTVKSTNPFSVSARSRSGKIRQCFYGYLLARKCQG